MLFVPPCLSLDQVCYNNNIVVVMMLGLLNGRTTMADVICVTGDVRLVGGSNPLEGRLEVCFFNQWGTICSGSWGQNEAGVVCGQLGYARTGMYKVYKS